LEEIEFITRILLEVLMTQVAAAVIFQNEKILVTRRGPGEKHAGCWEFPGGKLEASETFQQCIEREKLYTNNSSYSFFRS
jgi:8-oxo-dGTP pyrophosphatase MutT (NUDIX family)